MGNVVYLAGERAKRRGQRAAAAVTARFLAALSDEELRSTHAGVSVRAGDHPMGHVDVSAWKVPGE